jgi:hypothetical protein
MLKKIIENEDYIRCPKFDNSLNKFTNNQKNSEGVKNSTIARLLMMTEEEVEVKYQEAVTILREAIDEE